MSEFFFSPNISENGCINWLRVRYVYLAKANNNEKKKMADSNMFLIWQFSINMGQPYEI